MIRDDEACFPTPCCVHVALQVLSAVQGAGVMALFAAGSAVSMMAGSWLWLRLQGPRTGNWGVRLAGFALAASSFWALWMGFAHDAAPWCLSS